VFVSSFRNIKVRIGSVVNIGDIVIVSRVRNVESESIDKRSTNTVVKKIYWTIPIRHNWDTILSSDFGLGSRKGRIGFLSCIMGLLAIFAYIANI